MIKKDYNNKKVENNIILKRKYIIKNKVNFNKENKRNAIILLESLLFFIITLIFSFNYILTLF